MNTKDAIKQRFVDLNLVSFHETMGICFGRPPAEPAVQFKEVQGRVERHL
jgi:hypothetical protein